MITTLLIANRGEIARRIIRTASAMGISTVAVYADGDAGEPFVREADRAVALPGRTAAETYLNIDALLRAAVGTGADAIHPGYGFLSERAAFARAVIAAGLTWVGPPPDVIEIMGDKLAAKNLMAEVGVPVLPTWEIPADLWAGLTDVPPGPVDVPADGSIVPGYGDVLPAEILASGGDVSAGQEDAALDHGGVLPVPGDVVPGGGEVPLPLLVKAAAGGGGKGMRVVSSAGELAGAVAAARREAAAAFGDPTVFGERYITGARHVEIQVLADAHGGAVHCFERECSIQRRHQKIIEECPSPALDDDLRERMGAAALAAAKTVGYQGAGTVEFVLEPSGDFWFLEVNTRLQVEHPVTEVVTGLDLVREQLLVAQGLPLSVTQAGLAMAGHAIEARLYAEDPAAGFLPMTGTLLDWHPATDPRCRWDSGAEQGSVAGVEFDPLLAKVIAHAPTRTEAALRLALALERSRIRGVSTNRDFLVATLRHPRFLAGDTTTDFIERARVALARRPSPGELRIAAVAAALAAQLEARAATPVLRSLPSGWRNSVMPPEKTVYRHGPGTLEVAYRRQRDGRFAVWVRAAGFAGTGHGGEDTQDEAGRDGWAAESAVPSRADNRHGESAEGAVPGAADDRHGESAEGAVPGAADDRGGESAQSAVPGTADGSDRELRAPGNRAPDQGAAIRAIPGKAEEGASLYRLATDENAARGSPGAASPAVLLPGALSRMMVVLHRVDGGWVDLDEGGRRHRRHVFRRGGRVWVQGPDGDVALTAVPRFPVADAETVAGGLVAPMPGTVLSVEVSPGDPVTAGQLLMIVEAMKMEHRITAPHAGTVTEVRASRGDQVAEGDLLAVLEEAP